MEVSEDSVRPAEMAAMARRENTPILIYLVAAAARSDGAATAEMPASGGAADRVGGAVKVAA